MTTSSTGPRTTQRSDSFTINLNAYALAAAAAGVSALALIQPSEAEVVFTPTNKVLPGDFWSQIDLNHDGSPDFKFNQYTFSYRYWFNDLDIWPRAEKGIIESSKGYAAVLERGAPIGAGQIFHRGERAVLLRSRGFAFTSTTATSSARKRQKKAAGGDKGKGSARFFYGPWQYATENYVGVTFNIDGAPHYGWIRLSISIGFRRFTTTLKGYAYETTPAKTIYAGQLSEKSDAAPQAAPIAKPALGVLALGAPGLNLWSREAPPSTPLE